MSTDWQRLAEERQEKIDHLLRHIDQLRTGEAPMPNGQYVANPMPKCGRWWGPSPCEVEGHVGSCACVQTVGHLGKCMCACGESPSA